ncbi:MAG: quinone-dependent dihydroorotate dehydrogenase [Balneola sp.]|nr:quinone-dependent dihydroorotate dehydrogenase [Balneola sp.]MBO6649441.1 quinone-dependent dihydroorotate dehydrogenase [Balneola sp.]MBO6711256.1 quinone-dependent dihydroorotate dehydrogenase [Balneola sp.]MBO6800629.1 quinone-dependent dihydroorotate dehydrogenase [Balneola sp.]MBO6869191.1 quinone-dependent dihydroorotate dehydrogenase [Balneola sp.]
MLYKNLLKPVIFKKDAEEAHDLAIKISSAANYSVLLQALASIIYGGGKNIEKKYWGLKFKNPIGLAAGFDKNGTTPKAMEALGFGFVEIGSITAKPSKGNPKPRAFRLPDDNSLINRMGLNNEGTDVIIDRLKDQNLSIPLGVNIAKTNDASIHGKDAISDYTYSYEKALSVADYITVNISCPNTGEGKTFEDPEALTSLLKNLNPSANEIPTLVKFSVDTEKKVLQKLVDICENYNIAGYVATNTSSSRDDLNTKKSALSAIGNGGLSGAAISRKSDAVISTLYEILQGSKPIIGVGGIDSVESAQRKVDAGANLLQIYTGLVYEGPGLIKKLKNETDFR